MTSPSALLERYKLQTFDLKPDKYVHVLSAEQAGGVPVQILYKKRGGSAGQLGGGSFGAVHLQDADSEVGLLPRIRAVKSISKDVARANKIHWEQEVENLIALSKFPDLFVIIYGWWEDDKFIYLPMEYFAAGDLSNCKASIRDEADVRIISLQIATGLCKMHRMNIIHRDLKPHNIFVAQQRPHWQVKIGDFGFSKRISDSVSAPFSTRGTVKYMAPEYRDLWSDTESSDFTAAVDMWSFGCLIYELFAHRCPFEDEDVNSLKKYLKDKVFPREALDRVAASNESIFLIEKLLDPDPLLRWDAQDALNSAWLSSDPTEKEMGASPITHDFAGTESMLGSHHGSSASGQTTPRAEYQTSTVNSRPDMPRIESAPPELVVSSFDEDEAPPHPQLPSHPPPMPHRPALVPEVSDMASIRQDTPLVETTETLTHPPLPLRTRSIDDLHASFVEQGLKRQDSLSTSTALEIIQPSSIELVRGPVRRQSSKKKTMIRRKPAPKPTPTLTSTLLPGGHITMDFRNLAFTPQPKPTCDLCEQRRIFNPVIKPAALYVCQTCGGRPLCARCIVETIRNPADPHEADHKLQAWIQAHILNIDDTLTRSPHLASRSTGGLQAGFGEAWVTSDRAFAPPKGGHLDTLWTTHAPPGEYTLAARIKIASQPEMVKGSSIGKHRNLMVKSRAVPLGSILMGAHTLVPADLLIPKEGAKRGQHFMPEGVKEQKVSFAEDERAETLVLTNKITVTAENLLRIHIRGSYDGEYFKAGAPYKWWLEEILIHQAGPLDTVASIGDLKARETLLARQRKLRHERSMEKSLKIAGDVLTVATKLSGLGSSSSSKQNGLMLSAVSAGLNLGSTVMKDGRKRGDGGGGGGRRPAQAPVVMTPQHNNVYNNNYYYSNDNVGDGNDCEVYGGVEYDVEEDGDSDDDDDDDDDEGSYEGEGEEEQQQGMITEGGEQS